MKMGARLVALSLLAGAPAMAQEYTFTLVDSLAGSYSLRETYLWDISEAGMACGPTSVSDTDANGNISITTGACTWSPAGQTRITLSSPHGINNAGLVVGFGRVLDTNSGVMTTVPAIAGLSATPVLLGVNDAGVVVGYEPTCTCSNSQGLQQVPYVWSAAAGARTLAVPGATGAGRINAGGLVVGWIGGRASPNSFVFDLGSAQYTLMAALFPVPPDGYARKTTADDVSDTGVVTGSRLGDDFTTTYGYTWVYGSAGAPTLLPLPPAPDYRPVVRPQSINRSGVVVGGMVAADGYERAFVYDPANGSLRDLNTLTMPAPGFVMRTAYRINDQGWIVGYGQGGGGFSRSFVLRPAGAPPACGSADFNCDGDVGTDADIESFFACIAGACPSAPCGSNADFNSDGDIGTDADIEAFFRVLGGGSC